MPEAPEFVASIYTIYRLPGPSGAQRLLVRQWKVNGSYVASGWRQRTVGLTNARRLVPKTNDLLVERLEHDDPAIVESWL